MEMLVAITMSIIILGIVATTIMSAANMTSIIHGRIAAFHDSNLALDYMARDLAAILPPNQSISGSGTTLTQTTLTIYPDNVNGVSTWWIMCLTRPRETTTPGSVATVSYRMAYQDPNQSTTGSTKSFGLYRSVITTINPALSFFNQSDLDTGFWTPEWPSYAKNNIVPIDDYLLGDVAGITIKLNYRYYTSATDTTGTVVSVPLTSPVNCTATGFVGSDIAVANGANVPLSVDMIFTILRSHGASLYQAGEWTLSQAISRDGITLSRKFPILANSVD